MFYTSEKTKQLKILLYKNFIKILSSIYFKELRGTTKNRNIFEHTTKKLLVFLIFWND